MVNLNSFAVLTEDRFAIERAAATGEFKNLTKKRERKKKSLKYSKEGLSLQI